MKVVNYVLFVVNHSCSRVVKSKSGCCFMGKGRCRPDAAAYDNKCMRKTMQARGGSGSGRVRADSSCCCVGLRRVRA